MNIKKFEQYNNTSEQMKSIKTKEQIFRECFALFVDSTIPDDIFNAYMNDVDGSASLELQAWLISNMKDSIADWATGIGIIDAVELMYNSAMDNGNIQKKI